jgi:hypothetical protein
MAIPGASDTIRGAVLEWEGTEAHPHRFGGIEYRLGSREIGHIHGDWLVDIPFPKKVHDEVVSSGHAQLHHILPESGWVSLYLHEAEDVQRAIQLLRTSYEIGKRQKEHRNKPGA